MVSGTRQTQQRHSLIKANYVTSSPLVLAYALAGNVQADLENGSLNGSATAVTLRDIWPNRQEIEEIEDEIIIKKILNQMSENIRVREAHGRFLHELRHCLFAFRLAMHNGIRYEHPRLIPTRNTRGQSTPLTSPGRPSSRQR